MTQPCHKDTTLNQQHCDREHGRWGEGEEKEKRDTTIHTETTRTPPHFPTHTEEKGETMRRELGTMREGGDPIQSRGNTQPPRPAIQHGHHANRRGTPTFNGESVTQPPFITMPPTIRYATHPSAMAPPTIHDEGGADRGYPTTRTAQTHTLTLTPHTRQGTVHDTNCSAGEYCSGMSRARAAPLHQAGQQQQHTPPPFHTPRRRDTIHSSTHHSHSFVFTQQMINDDQ